MSMIFKRDFIFLISLRSLIIKTVQFGCRTGARGVRGCQFCWAQSAFCGHAVESNVSSHRTAGAYPQSRNCGLCHLAAGYKSRGLKCK